MEEIILIKTYHMIYLSSGERESMCVYIDNQTDDDDDDDDTLTNCHWNV